MKTTIGCAIHGKNTIDQIQTNRFDLYGCLTRIEHGISASLEKRQTKFSEDMHMMLVVF
jgi:hypothetical protein